MSVVVWRRRGEREFKLLFHKDVDVGLGPVSQLHTKHQLFESDISAKQSYVSY